MAKIIDTPLLQLQGKIRDPVAEVLIIEPSIVNDHAEADRSFELQ